jgi:hypothetical protein
MKTPTPIAIYSDGFPNPLGKWQELMYEYWASEYCQNYHMGLLTENEAQSQFVIEKIEESKINEMLTKI